MVENVFLIFVGFVLLIKGADFLVNGSVKVAKKLHIPEIIIGLTIVSIGTSMPELIVSVTSALNGHSDMALGNVIGSNICNVLLILGLSAVVRPVVFKKETKLIEIPIALGAGILLLFLGNNGESDITRLDGIILAVCFIAFIVYTIYMGIKESKHEKEEEKDGTYIEEVEKYGVIKAIGYIVLGIIGLKFGGDLVVNNSCEVARIMGLSEKIISLTIIAIGTSLPELATSVMAAFKGESDIAIGNIVGSNIFNLLLIIGTASIIHPMSYSLAYNKDMAIILLATGLLALFPFIGKKDMMTRSNGVICLVLYVGYMVTLFV